ncbi:MAG: aminotransferase class I/II-fold pyridoxal phosphate-dependent enzyme, partial [Treponema socranskii subsp. buccale]
MKSKRMAQLHPYVPGEQPVDRTYIKLNANENPYPPSPNVISAVIDFIKKHPEKLALYPDPDAGNLRKAIADMLNRTGGVLV